MQPNKTVNLSASLTTKLSVSKSKSKKQKTKHVSVKHSGSVIKKITKKQ